jgi:hypothetical protein
MIKTTTEKTKWNLQKCKKEWKKLEAVINRPPLNRLA